MDNKATTFKAKIVESVIQDIVDGVYQPGTVLTEKALIEKYNVSKSPVRDALMELCADEVLRNIPRFGYQIVEIDRERMYEMMEFRFYLESESLRKAIRFVTEQNIRDLEALEGRVQQDIQANPNYPVIAHWHNNTQFHLLLVSLARNQYVQRELEHTMNIQLRGYAQYFGRHAGEEQTMLSSTCHTAIIEALKHRDAKAAIEGLRQDLGKINLLQQYSIFE